MENKENNISRVKELAGILDKCAREKEGHPCANCLYGQEARMILVCRKLIEDLLKEVDKL